MPLASPLLPVEAAGATLAKAQIASAASIDDKAYLMANLPWFIPEQLVGGSPRTIGWSRNQSPRFDYCQIILAVAPQFLGELMAMSQIYFNKGRFLKKYLLKIIFYTVHAHLPLRLFAWADADLEKPDADHCLAADA
jgi:hypothetical protein